MVLPQASCNEIIPLLDAYFDAELSESEKEVVQLHLSGCADCSTRLAGIASLVSSLRAMPKVEMSRDITAIPLADKKVVAFKPRTWALVGAAAAVALVAVAMFNGALMQPPTIAHKVDQVKPQPPSAGEKPAPAPAPENTTVAVKPQASKQPGTTSDGGNKVASHQATPNPPVGTHTKTGARDSHAPATNQNSLVASNVAPNGNQPADSRDSLEVAVISDDGSFSDALGIATDEDGLYELKM